MLGVLWEVGSQPMMAWTQLVYVGLAFWTRWAPDSVSVGLGVSVGLDISVALEGDGGSPCSSGSWETLRCLGSASEGLELRLWLLLLTAASPELMLGLGLRLQ